MPGVVNASRNATEHVFDLLRALFGPGAFRLAKFGDASAGEGNFYTTMKDQLLTLTDFKALLAVQGPQSQKMQVRLPRTFAVRLAYD